MEHENITGQKDEHASALAKRCGCECEAATARAPLATGVLADTRDPPAGRAIPHGRRIPAL